MNRNAIRITRCASLAVCALVAAIPAVAHADDLRDALTSAYATNPTLAGARAQQRSLDETVPLARSAALPSASGSAQLQENILQGGSGATSPDRLFNGSIGLAVPVYSGGATRNSIRAAEIRVDAGQADLRATEAAIFSQVVASYMDVIRDGAIVDLSRQNVRVLDVNLQATRDRFEIGDLTRTDVAQSDSRLALARSDLQSSEANLISSKERYIQLIGKPPLDLQPPPPLPGLPETPDDAVDIALAFNPDLIAAKERSRAAGLDIRIAGSNRLPRVELFTNSGYTNYLGSLGNDIPNADIDQSQLTTSAGVRASIPIFQGGRPAALERQAQARAGAVMEQEIAIERDVVAQTRASFASYRAANQVIASSQRAVEAATLSLEGVRAENTVGNRTILDILNAEQELLRAQVQLVSARRNAYVAGFSLLAAMGKAEARDLGLDGGALYDPEVNYDRVRRKFNDWAHDPAPVVQSTRTNDTPAQDATDVGR